MTDLAQTALEFCRECLGWDDAVLLGLGNEVWENKHICTSLNPKNFNYGDLNTVMSAVRGWCSENEFFLSTCTTPTLGEVSAQVFQHGIRAEVCHPCFGHALLAACVQASLKLGR